MGLFIYFCTQIGRMEFLYQILGPDPETAGIIILNLIIIESLLSVDNAAVLATMVMDLPAHQRKKALKYGILGAYIFRGICLISAAYLMHIWWLKPLGGGYLLFLCIHHFLKKPRELVEQGATVQKKSKLYRYTLGMFGPFWATVIMVEMMDLAFSIDNVFAAVAYVENYPQPYALYLVWIGVFIGIMAMRLVAQFFVKLMEKYPFLETAAFIVIGILGLKLTISVLPHFYPDSALLKLMEGEKANLYFSLVTVAVFVVPILSSWLFGYPGRRK